MNTIILTSLLGPVVATTAYAGFDIRELAGIGTSTVESFAEGD